MKAHLTCFLALICAAAVSAQTPDAANPPAPTNGPVLTVLGADDYNFGPLDEGTAVNHTFVISNSGNATLIIKSVKPGCHCTTPQHWSDKVEPGQTGEIALRLDTHGMRGEIHRNVRVDSNDRTAPTRMLILQANVRRAIEVSPDYAFIQVHPHAATNSTSVVMITNELAAPLILSNVECNSKAFSAELFTNKPGREFKVVVTALPPFTPGINGSCQITVHTSFTNMPVVTFQTVTVPQPD